MKTQSQLHRLPYRAEQIFDLVADIERYPEFLPQWTFARIEHQLDGRLEVLQEIDLGFRQLRFHSQACMHRPRQIRITTTQAPFRLLAVDWQFEATAPMECLVKLKVEIDMFSPILEAAAVSLTRLFAGDVVYRFRQRAEQRYGVPGTRKQLDN